MSLGLFYPHSRFFPVCVSLSVTNSQGLYLQHYDPPDNLSHTQNPIRFVFALNEFVNPTPSLCWHFVTNLFVKKAVFSSPHPLLFSYKYFISISNMSGGSFPFFFFVCPLPFFMWITYQ